MATEISSGGVVVQKTNNKLQILLLKDKNNQWSFPKGLMEKNEEKLETAKREIGEEVNIFKLKLICELSPIKYFYKWGSEIVRKTVYFFLFETFGKEEPVPQKEEGIQEVKWFSFAEAAAIIGYKETNKAVLEETLRIYGMD